MPRIRVLLIDDSVVMRRMLSDALSTDPGLQVVGSAANGAIGLAMIEQHAPDLVTLDVEMPVMDGLTTLKEIRKTRKDLPVIMFSTLTQRGAEITIDALSAGASDYVTKPSGAGNVVLGKERIRESLIPKIKALCSRRLPYRIVSEQSPIRLARASKDRFVRVLLIGSSTGGPNALAEIIPSLPPDLGVPVLIVQHMPPTFTRFLAQRLNSISKLPVKEASHGDEVRAGEVLIAPGDNHMLVAREGLRTVVRLAQDPPENSCRPSVDVLFRSAAETFRSGMLAVVLTGMGQDGLKGCELLSSLGAQIVVQDEISSVVWGMPGFVAKAGLADSVLPLTAIGPDIARRVKIGRPATVVQ